MCKLNHFPLCYRNKIFYLEYSLLKFLSSDMAIKLILMFSLSSILVLVPHQASEFSTLLVCLRAGAAKTSCPFNWKSGGSVAFKLGGLSSGVRVFLEWWVGVGGHTGRLTRFSLIPATWGKGKEIVMRCFEQKFYLYWVIYIWRAFEIFQLAIGLVCLNAFYSFQLYSMCQNSVPSF